MRPMAGLGRSDTMHTVYGLVALVVVVVVVKWYTWCQMAYWYGTEFRERQRSKTPKDHRTSEHER